MATAADGSGGSRHPDRDGKGKGGLRTSGGGKRGSTPQKGNLFDKKMEPCFEEYWTKDRVQCGLKRGELIQGVLRINQKKYEEAYMDDPDGGPDYSILGVRLRNRALHGDVVAIEVLPRDQWQMDQMAEALVKQMKSSYADPTDMALESASIVLEKAVDSTSIVLEKASSADGASVGATAQLSPVKETLVDKLYAPLETEPSGADPFDLRKARRDETNRRELYTHRRTAKVVYIVHKEHNRACCGYLKAYDKVRKLALLSPRDFKVPRVVVPLNECPEGYPQNAKKFESTLIIARILDWSRDELFPTGSLMRSLGEAGELEPETNSFLLENDIDSGDFPQSVLDCLPQDFPWSIPREEEVKRRDFRKECVFSIDPASARDLDDALHVKELEKGVYEVGVHIADVTYFVKTGTALDAVARQRATSVYLVQKVIPMLPRLLCEKLCSLNPCEEKLTVSVVWKITASGELLDEWMGRSMICSCAKLSYEQAQTMIDDPYHDWTTSELPLLSGGVSISNLSTAVGVLNKLAKMLRSQRQAKGTLRLDQPKIVFILNQDTGMPNGISVYKHKDSNKLIEEFMLLANMSVARRIHKAYPDQAILRCHPCPKEKSSEILAAKLASLGISLDVSSAATIQESINNFTGLAGDKQSLDLERMALVSLCSKIMELARYFCSGDVEVSVFHHYALNVPQYSHFTSPIRRYADIIVHRQLVSALDEVVQVCAMDDDLISIAENCNKKKKTTKVVEDFSRDLFLCVFVRECGPVAQKGIVVGILDKAFDVLVVEFGVTKRIYTEKLPISDCEHRIDDGGRPVLVLMWCTQSDNVVTQEIAMFSTVELIVMSSKTSLQYNVKIVSPTK